MTLHSTPDAATDSVRPQDLADEAIALVRRWLSEAANHPVDPAAARLAGVLKDPNGLDFTVGFVDGVVRPEDLKVAARKLSSLAPKVPAFLPWYMKTAVALGGRVAPLAPSVVIPIARRVLRQMVSHLIVDATEHRLGPAIEKIQRPGTHLNINLLGEAILGQHEAERRLAGTAELLARDDVDYVSIKVSSTVAPHNHWAFDEAVDHIIEKLAPLYRQAASFSPAKFINLDMEEYKDLELTMAVFKRLLERDEFKGLQAGIVLQAYLPDALGAMIELQDWAAQRVADGGAPIKVRLVKGANLPMESMDADLRDWPLATWGSKQDSDTSYKAVLDYALTPERIRNVRLGVAGHNLFDIALAHLLAERRGISTHGEIPDLEFEMLLGMATGQAEAVKKDVGSLLLYTPVVHPREFDVAIAYLIRRLEEGASHENFMSAVFELDKNEELFEREKQRFLASVEALEGPGFAGIVPAPNRVQNRAAEIHRYDDAAAAAFEAGFTNTPDTDPDLPANRDWGREILDRVPGSRIGEDLVEQHKVRSGEELEGRIGSVLTAAEAWGAMSGAERARVLDRIGVKLANHRAEMLEVMAVECGKTLDQGDPEVSEAIDFAHYYAQLAREIDRVEGAEYVPSKLIAVIPPWNFPTAIPCGGVVAALAAGSAVAIKPARQAARTGSVMVQAVWEALDEAGIGRDLVQLIHVDDRDLGRQLVGHPAVDRLILTGGYETAELFRSFRTDLPLLAETSGKNALIVTPSADLDLAAKDVAYSAFGHAGQKCSAGSLVILVGSVATSRRFHDQLVDAVQSLTVDYPTNPEAQMGPIIEPAAGKLLRGLTELGEGERWVLEPKQLDDSGKLWSPGLRSGVKPGSEYHLTEYFGPILGVMTADTLEEAIEYVNATDFGLTSGLHSLDPDEMAYWVDRVDAGNLYINRGITGAIVQRQPFGGWKKSAVGAGTKAGGPNYLVGLGDWRDKPLEGMSAPIAGAPAALLDAARDVLDRTDADWLANALSDDADQWAREFGVAKDPTGLIAERNVFRYRPMPVTVRLAGEPTSRQTAELFRVVGAGLRVWQAHGHAAPGARVTVSVDEVGEDVLRVLRGTGALVVEENEQDWELRVSRLAAMTGPEAGARLRLIGADPVKTYEAADGAPIVAVYDHPVVSAGRVELLPFLREQAVSITAHRFGTPDHLSDGVI
ncbi:bifunctional proline dehydrogenase/L-glutamate gamma-semialdehyde dehydrogenase [Zhihengliuella sp.]|uniref:bifunctional proline dehydrogenase/L-glutamate gamma-semialdehyde dehydrogenase n=1 Tax=Zhihengliuella sp. TaxID=1954483 RepID=UPI00281168C1|nr:bifunctional proline dehydrogenase/L-glutamate gamma-semialdehyde dehydrogenase [Zhihengliuella sp.]